MASVSVRDASETLHLTPQQVKNLARSGKLAGAQMSDGTWVLDSASFAEYQQSKSGPGRHWSPQSSWALLYELSGLPNPTLSPSSRSRTRKRIQTTAAIELARKVATRTTGRKYLADSKSRTAAGLILTGRSAADQIGTALAGQLRFVDGYLQEGTSLQAFVDDHLLVESPRGDVTIYEREPDVEWIGTHAPEAVIAADLSRSTDPRERNEGLAALERMREQWLALHTG